MCKKLLALLLAMLMTVSLLATPAMAAADEPGTSSFPDSEGHWAETSIDRWADSGIVQGDEQGNVTPDAFLKRGELAQMLVRLLGLTEVAENTFGDLKGTEWYAQPVLKCAAAGIMQGDERHYILGNDPVTRQEAMVMLGRSLGMQKAQDPDMSQFGDAEDVDDWGACYMAPLAQMGILTGIQVAGEERNMVVPDGPINRASMLTLLDRAITAYVTEPGEYTVDNTNGFVVVNVDGTGDVTISGTTAGVVVSHGTDEAAVTLSGITADTVRVDGDADVRIEEKSAVDELTVNGNSDVTIAKNSAVENVTKNGEDATVTHETTNPPVVIRPNNPGTPSTPTAPAVEDAEILWITDEESYDSFFGIGKYGEDTVNGTHNIQLPWLLVGYTRNETGTVTFSVTKDGVPVKFGTTDDHTVTGNVVKSDTLTFEATSVNPVAYVSVHLLSQEATDHVGQDWLDNATTDGEYTVTVSLNGDTTTATKTFTTPVVPVEPEASTATFSVMDETLYNSITWAGKPATLADMQEDVTFTPGADENATTVAVTGTLKYVTGFTGFNDTKTEEQEGNYLALMFSVPTEATNDGTITLVAGHEGTADKTYTVGTPGAVDIVGGAKYFALIQRVASTASTVQIKIDWDGEGNKFSESTYTLTFANATLETKTVVTPAVASTTTFSVMDAGLYSTITWDGKPKTLADMQDGVTFGTADAQKNVAVTGTLKYVTGFTGFNDTKTEEQEGNYLALMFSVPTEATDDGTITLVAGHEGTADKTYTVGTPGAVDIVGGAKYFALIQRVAGTDSTVQIKIDWDGAGEAFTESTYTLTFANATLEEKTVAPVEPVASETTFSVMDADLYNSITWDGKPDTLADMQDGVAFGTADAQNNVAVTGTLKYVEGFTGFNDTKTEEQEGNYVALMFSVPADATDAATFILVKGHEGTADKSYLVKDVADTLENGKYIALIQRVASKQSTVQIEIDWDGAGEAFSKSTYTLTFANATLEEKVPAVANAEIALLTDEQTYDDFFGAGRYDTDTVDGTHDIELPWLAVKYERNETGTVTFSVTKSVNGGEPQLLRFGTTKDGTPNGELEMLDTVSFNATTTNQNATVTFHLLKQNGTHRGQVWLDNETAAVAAGHYVVTISLNGETTTAEYDVPDMTVVEDKVVAMRQALDYYTTYYDKFASQWITDPGLVDGLNELTGSTGFSATNFDAAKVYFPVGDWTADEVTSVTVNGTALDNDTAGKTRTSIGNNGFIYSYAWKVIEGKLCLNLPMLAGLAGTNQKGEAAIQVNDAAFVTLKLFNFPEQNTLTLTGASNHSGLKDITSEQVDGTWTVTGKVTGGNSLLGVTFGYKADPASETITNITDASTGNYMVRQDRNNVQSTAVTELGEAGVSYRLYPYGWKDGATTPTEGKTLNFTIVVPGCGSIDLDVVITVEETTAP